MTIQENVALSAHTTFRAGGPARFFVEAQNENDIRASILFARERNLPLLVMGGGSNLLVSDEGCEGVVLKVRSRGLAVEEENLTAEAGEAWDDVVSHAVERGLWGIENLSGIPGSAGAAPVQNIGAYGASFADTFHSLDALNLATLSIRTFSREECAFSYRSSFFKQHGGHIILRIRLRLTNIPTRKLSYRDLAEYFKEVENPSLQEIRNAVLSIRSNKFPDLTREGTAGSFFLNPTLSADEAGALAVRFPGMPRFAEGEKVKIPLAWLLDKALSFRGVREGGVRAFERQPLVIVNDGTATARDIRTFARTIQDAVLRETGLRITPEVCILRGCTVTRELD